MGKTEKRGRFTITDLVPDSPQTTPLLLPLEPEDAPPPPPARMRLQSRQSSDSDTSLALDLKADAGGEDEPPALSPAPSLDVSQHTNAASLCVCVCVAGVLNDVVFLGYSRSSTRVLTAPCQPQQRHAAAAVRTRRTARAAWTWAPSTAT